MSLPIFFTILAVFTYLLAFSYLLKQLTRPQIDYQKTTNPFLIWAILFTGAILHMIVLSMDMLTPWGINYDIFNLISFTSLLMLLLSTCFSIYRPVMVLNLIATPVAMVGLIIGNLFSSPKDIIIEQGIGIDIHIILSLTAYAVLFMATIHAIFIYFQNRELKKKQKYRIWVNLLPSLQTMESLLFDLIVLGFGLLTIALIFGFLTIENFFGQHLAHKTVFSFISWLVYGTLLIGHWKWGWRGIKAVRFSLIGFTLLAIGFFGSKFILEIILVR